MPARSWVGLIIEEISDSTCPFASQCLSVSPVDQMQPGWVTAHKSLEKIAKCTQ